MDIYDFKSFLVKEKGYPADKVRICPYIWDNKAYKRVEVLSKDRRKVQSFVLMDEKEVQKEKTFPFYRSYRTSRTNISEITPLCFVVSLDDSNNQWEVRYPGDLNLKYESYTDIFNYEKAVHVYTGRLKRLPFKILCKKIRSRAIISAVILATYLVAWIVLAAFDTSFQLPLTSEMCLTFALIVILLFVPQVAPFVKSFSLGKVAAELDRKSNNSHA